MKVVQRPLTPAPSSSVSAMPPAISTSAIAPPIRAAMRVARRRSFVVRHTSACNTRPPSSGYAGRKLKTASAALANAR